MNTSLDLDQVKELLSKKKGRKFLWILVGIVVGVAALITVVFLLRHKEEEDWDDDDFDDEDWDDDEDEEDEDEDEEEDDEEESLTEMIDEAVNTADDQDDEE